jgi:hypothetical protein
MYTFIYNVLYIVVIEYVVYIAMESVLMYDSLLVWFPVVS